MTEYPLVRAFHGTTRSAAQAILTTRDFRLSHKPVDWLGDGFYFWQDAPYRAWEWATEQYPGQDIAVLGALLRYDRYWIDLFDPSRWLSVISEAYKQLADTYKAFERKWPEQKGGAHRVDRLVLNQVVNNMTYRGLTIGAVRAPFKEGKELYAQSDLFTKDHVQIALLNGEIVEEIWLEPQP